MNADTKRSHIGQRVIAGAALVVALVCGWSVGFRTVPTDHDVTFITNTPRPALSVQPTPVYAPQIAAMEETQMEQVNPQDFFAVTDLVQFVINVVFALVTGGAVGFSVALARMNKEQKDNAERMYESLPPQWGTILRDIVVGGKAAFERLDEITDGKPNTPPAEPGNG